MSLTWFHCVAELTNVSDLFNHRWHKAATHTSLNRDWVSARARDLGLSLYDLEVVLNIIIFSLIPIKELIGWWLVSFHGLLLIVLVISRGVVFDVFLLDGGCILFAFQYWFVWLLLLLLDHLLLLELLLKQSFFVALRDANCVFEIIVLIAVFTEFFDFDFSLAFRLASNCFLSKFLVKAFRAIDTGG